MLDNVKQALRIDGAEEDIDLQSLIDDAKIEIKHSTGVTVDENDEFHKRTIIMMVKISHGDFDDDPRAKESIEKSINSRLFKIKNCYPSEVVITNV
jgi:uncharacterized phage protein (predicted DNA packaging)